MKGAWKYALLLLLACCTLSCRRGRIIPSAKFIDIYADMFLADQWIADNPAQRKVADTSDFYGPIFKKYGYTFEDYDASVQYYLREPEKFSDITNAAAKKLEDMHDEIQAELDRIEAIKRFDASFPPFIRKDFKKDTILRIRLWSDSLQTDTLHLDSLAVDSLLVDSLALDSLALDSLAVDSLETKVPIVKPDSNVTRRNRFRPHPQPEAGQLLGNKPVAHQRKDM